MSPLNNQELEIGFCASRVFEELLSSESPPRCRTSWAQISSTAAYCTWDKTKRLKINRLVIKISRRIWLYVCVRWLPEQRERPGLLDLLFSDEYLMDCATRRPRGMMGSGGRYRCISLLGSWPVASGTTKCSVEQTHTLRIRVRPPPLGFIIIQLPCVRGRVEANANSVD